MEERLTVSTEELAELMQGNSVYVVDGTMVMGEDREPIYASKHIPGAVYYDLKKIKGSKEGISFPLPSLEQFTACMRELKLPNDGKTVVVYDQTGFSLISRVWFTLKYFGYASVKVLDGGLPKWEAEGREVVSGDSPNVESDAYNFSEHPEMVATYEEAKAAVESGSAELWDPRPVNIVQAGAVPGVKTCPGAGAFNENKTLKTPEEIRTILQSAGIALDKPMITSCMKGMAASVGYFLLRYIGKHESKIFLGSFEEWKLNNP